MVEQNNAKKDENDSRQNHWNYVRGVGSYKSQYLNIIEVIMYHVCLIDNSKTADVTVTKIAGYVRVRILMNRWFFRIFGIHIF